MNGNAVAVLILFAVLVAFVLAEVYRKNYRWPPQGRYWKRRKI